MLMSPIVGGGMVGLALACGLQGSGLRVAALEQNCLQPVAYGCAAELRVSELMPSFSENY